VAIFIHDIVAMCIAIQLSFWLYYGDNIAYFSGFFLQKQMVIFSLLCAGFFLWFQTYRGVWRYVSLTQILILAGAIAFASLLYLPLATKMNVQNIKVPKILVLMNWGVAVSLVATSRLFYRAFTERWMAPENADLSSKPMTRLFMIGISRELETFLTHLRQRDTHNYEILGIISDNKKFTGRYLQSHQILGTVDDLPDLVENYNAEGEHPHQLVIASTKYFGQKLLNILKLAAELKLDLFKLPYLSNEEGHSLDILPLSIEDFFDIPNYQGLKNSWGSFFKGETVLVIGASNLIGKQLIRLLLYIGVHDLMLCDSNHLALAELKDELASVDHNSELHFFLTHLYDEKKYNYLLSKYKPTMILYLDGIYEDEVTEANPLETVAENTIKTKFIIDLVAKKKIKNFIYVIQSQISHDVSLGQLTLKVAEAYCQSVDNSQLETRFIPIKVSPIVSSDSEFVFKLKQLMEHRKPIKLNCLNQPYAFVTPETAAFSILKTIYFAGQNDHIRGHSYAEAVTEQLFLSDFIELLARLEGISLEDVGEIHFSPSVAHGERLDYQLKETLRFEKTTYQLLGFNLPLEMLDDTFKNLHVAIEQFDQGKAIRILNKLVTEVNVRSVRATHALKQK
jgi:O-antigen biosynthesis protein WbqV